MHASRSYSASALWILLFLATLPCATAQSIAPRAEVLAATSDIRFATGRETDMSMGDLVLDNGWCTAVVVGTTAGRRLPHDPPLVRGDLCDLNTAGAAHEALQAFRPGWEGPDALWGILILSSTHSASDDSARVVLRGRGFDQQDGRLLDVAVQHVFQLDKGALGLSLATTITNTGAQPWRFRPSDSLLSAGLPPCGTGELPAALFEAPEVRYALGVWSGTRPVHLEPADAEGWSVLGWTSPGERIELAPGDHYTWTREVMPSHGSARLLQAWARPHSAFLSGLLLASEDEDGEHAGGFPLVLRGKGYTLRARAPTRGAFGVALPSGSYLLSAERPGTKPATAEVELFAGSTWPDRLVVPRSAFVRLTVTVGRDPLPARVVVFGRGDTPDPVFGPDHVAQGPRNVMVLPPRDTDVFLPPGKYRLVFSAGPEYEVEEKKIELDEGDEKGVRVRLSQSVEPEGWISLSGFNQTTWSGRNLVSLEDRLLSLAGEGIRFAPITEAERLVDARSAIEAQGLGGWLRAPAGVVLPHLLGGELVAWPLAATETIDPWSGLVREPSQNAYETLSELVPPGWKPLVQWLVPGLAELVPRPGELPPRHRDDEGIVLRSLSPDLFSLVTTALQGLALGNAAAGDGAGSVWDAIGAPRAWVHCGETDLAKLRTNDVIDAIRRGEVVLSNGPFIDARLERRPERRNEPEHVRLTVEVYCPSWIEIDRVAVIPRGGPEVPWVQAREEDKDSFSGKKGRVFKHEWTLDALPPDGLLIVVTGPEGGLEKGTRPGFRTRPVALRLIDSHHME